MPVEFGVPTAAMAFIICRQHGYCYTDLATRKTLIPTGGSSPRRKAWAGSGKKSRVTVTHVYKAYPPEVVTDMYLKFP